MKKWGIYSVVVFALLSQLPARAEIAIQRESQELQQAAQVAYQRIPRLYQQIQALREDAAALDLTLTREYGFDLSAPVERNRSRLEGKSPEDLVDLVSALVASTEHLVPAIERLIGQNLVSIEELERVGKLLPPQAQSNVTALKRGMAALASLTRERVQLVQLNVTMINEMLYGNEEEKD